MSRSAVAITAVAVLLLITTAGIGASESPVDWKKYSDPVLDIGESGEWDDGHVEYPMVIKTESLYEMWYTGGHVGPYSGNNKIGYANSTDGIHWTKYDGNPVVSTGSGWDSYYAYGPTVIKDGDTYKMWYAGYPGGTHTTIGYATSPDGINWEKYPANPVLNTGGGWDSRYVENPTVIKDGAVYKMWYVGNSGAWSSIGYATSNDGIHWTKSSDNPVLEGEGGNVCRPKVIKDDSVYRMYYRGDETIHGEYRACYATSTDGINWEKSNDNPILELGEPGTWDDYGTDHPMVIKDGTTYEMWYAGYDGDSHGRIGYATMTSESNPLLTITSPQDGATVHTPNIKVTGTALDPSGIALVTVNGLLASGAPDWSTWSGGVTLDVGENPITVVATNTTGGSTTKAIDITYTPLLNGKVLSSSTNDGIENVTVTLVGTGKTNKTGTNGYYSFSGVADGSYTLTASKPGYIFSQIDVVVLESTCASPIMGSIDTTVINAEITSTVMPFGSFNPGDSVEVTITVKNTGTIEHTFYVGYSVRDPEDTFWDAPYVPVTLSPDESATETLSWTVQPRTPVGSYDVYTAAWATQHWSYLYDNLDRVNAYEIFSVQSNPGSVPGWTLNTDKSYNVLVNGKGYTAIWAANDLNNNVSWMIYDDSGKVPDIVTFQRAAKTATVAKMLGSDTTEDVESLKYIQERMTDFTGITVIGKVALWIRDKGAYLAGKFAITIATGGTSLTTEMPASAALKVAGNEIAKELSTTIIKDLSEMAKPNLDKSAIENALATSAVINLQLSASKIGAAADAIDGHEGVWTYDEANSYYDNYKYGIIDGMAYMNLTYELQPGSDFISQAFDVCKKVADGAVGFDFDNLNVKKLADAIDDINAVKSSAITREKYRNTFAVTDARFGIDARKLWNAYQDTNKVGGTLMCPGNLHAYDSEGRHVGMNLTGGIDLEIPNSYYSGPDAEPEIIRIYTPQDDNITFYVDNATTIGTFNLTLERQMNMTLKSVAYLNIFINKTTVVSASTNNITNPDHIMDIDYDGDGTVDSTIAPTHILINYAPNVSITTPAGVQSDNITISYNLMDAESDNCTIIAQYSLDNINWYGATMGEGGDGIVNLTSTLTGVDHTFIWASGADLQQTNANVYFRIRPYDGDIPGNYAATDAFDVDNRVRYDNKPPVAIDDIANTDEDTAITINVAVNDNDVDGNLDQMTANTDCTTCSKTAHCTLTNNHNGTFTYTPDPDYNGPDSFTYEICDTDGLCDTATVNIYVMAVNDAPVVSVDIKEQTVQYSDGIANIMISAKDVDSSSLTISSNWTNSQTSPLT